MSDHDQAARAIAELLEVMTKLRHPIHGCPWDLEQSFRSLIPHTLEEVYEVVDAIEAGDLIDMEEELGDLLFQVVFYAQLASEDGSFSFTSVAAGIRDKLVRRHPHVFPDKDIKRFGEPNSLTPEQVSENWERIKEEERAAKATKPGYQARETKGLLANVPQALPALARAEKLQSKAARVGFDWDSVEPVLEKIEEELAELREAVKSGNQTAVEHELGDLLFAAVNMARHSKLSSETALRRSNERFTSRFGWIEAKLESEDRDMSDVSLAELNVLWDEAKRSGL